MTTIIVEIRPALETDIPSLEKRFFQGAATKHTERYARQQKGDVVYLVASYEGQQVGHALLKWHGSQDAPVANYLEFACPDIEDVFVPPELRSQSIGSQLLEYAEQLVVEQGYAHIGLSVATTNESACRLYKRLGYKEAPFGKYVEQGEWVDTQGQSQRWQEICIYLIKELRTNAL